MVIEINDENFSEEIEKSKTMVIIDFFADWCGPCQMMKPVFEKLSTNYKDKLKFVKVNTDISPEIAQRYEIQGIPCLVIVKNSKEVDRIVGFNSELILKKKIDDILSNNK